MRRFQGTNWHSLKVMTLLLKKKAMTLAVGVSGFVDDIMITMMMPHSKGTDWDQTFDHIIAESRTQ